MFIAGQGNVLDTAFVGSKPTGRTKKVNLSKGSFDFRLTEDTNCVNIIIWRVGRVVEGSRLLTCRLMQMGPRVRISYSPPNQFPNSSVGRVADC